MTDSFLLSNERNELVRKLLYDLNYTNFLNTKFQFSIYQNYDNTDLYNTFNDLNLISEELDLNLQPISKKEKYSYFINDFLVKLNELVNYQNLKVNNLSLLLNIIGSKSSNYIPNSFNFNDKQKYQLNDNTITLYRSLYYFLKNGANSARFYLEKINNYFSNSYQTKSDELNIRIIIPIMSFTLSLISYLVLCFIIRKITNIKLKILNIFSKLQTPDIEIIISKCKGFSKELSKSNSQDISEWDKSIDDKHVTFNEVPFNRSREIPKKYEGNNEDNLSSKTPKLVTKKSLTCSKFKYGVIDSNKPDLSERKCSTVKDSLEINLKEEANYYRKTNPQVELSNNNSSLKNERESQEINIEEKQHTINQNKIDMSHNNDNNNHNVDFDSTEDKMLINNNLNLLDHFVKKDIDNINNSSKDIDYVNKGNNIKSIKSIY